MEIISTAGNSTIKVIPREQFTSGYVQYRNVSTNSFLKENSTFTFLENHVSFIMLETTKQALKVTEGQFVHFEVYKDDSTDLLMYRGRIFFTDQTINQTTDNTYSVNKDVYKEAQVGDNDYIIYE